MNTAMYPIALETVTNVMRRDDDANRGLLRRMRMLVICSQLLLLSVVPALPAITVDPEPTVYTIPGSHASDSDIAQGKRVILGANTTLSQAGGFTNPQELIDGLDNDGMLLGVDPWTSPQCFTVDLGRPIDIASIRVMTSDNSARGAWSDKAQVLVSDDNVHFEVLADKLAATPLLSKVYVGNGWQYTYSDGGTVVISGKLNGIYVAKHVQYVRFVAPPAGSQWGGWKISEIDVEATPGLIIPKPAGKVNIGGDVSQWDDALSIKLNKGSQVKMGKWHGPKQLSGDIKLMLDDAMLYVTADVTKHGSASNDYRGAEALDGDCVEIFLELRDLGNDSTDLIALIPGGVRQGSGYEYHILLNPGSSRTNPQIWFCRADTGMGRLEAQRVRGTNDAEAGGGQIVVRNKADGDGYIIESAIPLANFGKAVVTPGMQIGLDVAVDANVADQGGRTEMVHYASKDPANNPALWDRAFVHDPICKQKTEGEAVISVNGDVIRSFNGHDHIVRETFGFEPGGIQLNKYLGNIWSKDSGCFGRYYFSFDDYYGRFKLPGLDGKTEDEKRKLVFNREYWRNLDMNQVTPFWTEWQHLAKLRPKNLFIMFFGAASQFEADPAFGSKLPKLTLKQEQMLKGSPHEPEIRQMLARAGSEDRSYCLNKDKELYAEICVNILGKLKEIIPSDTQFMVTLDNETNWPGMFWNKPIIDDLFDSLEKYGGYQAGEVAANEWLKQYNPLYRAIKSRYPDVMVGGPDVCDPEFTEKQWGRGRWADFIRPILDGAEGLDFFDYHYGVHSKRAQVISETIGQYMHQKRGRSIPSVDSEAGSYIFFQSPDSLNQFKQGLVFEREWFGWLRNPDLSCGWTALSLFKLFDGFGRATGAAMPVVMFRSLRGKYLQCESNTAGMESVASIHNNIITAVALNDRGEKRQTQFRLRAPKGRAFTAVKAGLLTYDAKAMRIHHAIFEPVIEAGGDELVVNVKLPPFGTLSLEATLDKTPSPGAVAPQTRYIGDRVVFPVTTQKNEIVTARLPAEALNGSHRRFLLRVGFEKTTADSATVDVNGRASFGLPAQVGSDPWDKDEVTEIELDRNVLEEDNRISFAVSPGGKDYTVMMVSIISQDRYPQAPGKKSRIVNLDIGSTKCIASEEESKTMPDWYVHKSSAFTGKLPDLRTYWSFDDATGDIVPDIGRHTSNGRLMNGAVLEKGLRGKALQLNGKGACMLVNDSPLLHFDPNDSFSISLWLKLTDGGSGVILRKGFDKSINLVAQKGGYGDEFPVPMIRYELTSPVFTCSTTCKGSANVGDGKWHHVVAVRDASEGLTIIYVDGEYVGSGTGVLHSSIDSSDALCFGVSKVPQVNSFTATADSLNGWIDETAIYDGVLTLKQVKNLYKELAPSAQ